MRIDPISSLFPSLDGQVGPGKSRACGVGSLGNSDEPGGQILKKARFCSPSRLTDSRLLLGKNCSRKATKVFVKIFRFSRFFSSLIVTDCVYCHSPGYLHPFLSLGDLALCGSKIWCGSGRTGNSASR